MKKVKNFYFRQKTQKRRLAITKRERERDKWEWKSINEIQRTKIRERILIEPLLALLKNEKKYRRYLNRERSKSFNSKSKSIWMKARREGLKLLHLETEAEVHWDLNNPYIYMVIKS